MSYSLGTKHTSSATEQSKNLASYINQGEDFTSSFLLLENGFFLLLENGFKIILDQIPIRQVYINQSKN